MSAAPTLCPVCHGKGEIAEDDRQRELMTVFSQLEEKDQNEVILYAKYLRIKGQLTAYTVSEVVALRDACTRRWLFGTTVPHEATSRHYHSEAELTTCVEELVRTHMLAGHKAEDLRRFDEEHANPTRKGPHQCDSANTTS